MADRETGHPETEVLSTKLEEDFVAPLTAVRGALEILRDFSDLSDAERVKFIEQGLSGCTRLAKGVDALAHSVYAAGRRAHQPDATVEETAHDERIDLDPEANVAEIHLGGHTFENSQMVNAFYDRLEEVIARSGHKWFFLIDQSGLSIWPEAWVAFAHREKRLRRNASLGTARFDVDTGKAGHTDPSLFSSREAALEMIRRAQAEAGS